MKAILIGNSEYENNDLPFVLNDINRVQETFINRLNFDEKDIVIHKNKSAEEVNSEIDYFIAKESRFISSFQGETPENNKNFINSLIFIYFSG